MREAVFHSSMMEFGVSDLPRCHMCGDLPVMARLPDMVAAGLTTALEPSIISLHVVMASLLVTRL